MYTIDEIVNKIVELSAFKSVCRHYLASCHAALHVENAAIVRCNLTVASNSLKQLYNKQNECYNNKITPKKNLKVINYKYSKQEENAILHFNKDHRFTITE